MGFFPQTQNKGRSDNGIYLLSQNPNHLLKKKKFKKTKLREILEKTTNFINQLLSRC